MKRPGAQLAHFLTLLAVVGIFLSPVSVVAQTTQLARVQIEYPTHPVCCKKSAITNGDTISVYVSFPQWDATYEIFADFSDLGGDSHVSLNAMSGLQIYAAHHVPLGANLTTGTRYIQVRVSKNGELLETQSASVRVDVDAPQLSLSFSPYISYVTQFVTFYMDGFLHDPSGIRGINGRRYAYDENGVLIPSPIKWTGASQDMAALRDGPFTDVSGVVGEFLNEARMVAFEMAAIDGAGNWAYATTSPIRYYKDGEGPMPVNGVSNVLFLPGIKGSRLYENTLGFEPRRWEPNVLIQGDVATLEMDGDGQSIRSIHTKEGAVIDDIQLFGFQVDFYRSFLDQLDAYVSEGRMAQYISFAYDWRMSPIELVERGVPYDTGTKYLHEQVAALAASSKTGKVTIVGHSNGGLVAKALMLRLEREGSAHLIDKVVLVDSPQLGTPLAVAALLHGDFQNIPDWSDLLLSKAGARSLTRSMPGAHALLPSRKYFDSVADPVIDLSNAPQLRALLGITDGKVDTLAEFERFITEASGRARPSRSNVEQPEVLPASLISNALATHELLDIWQAPDGVQVIQVAGWGLNTPRGVSYIEKPKTVCGVSPNICTSITSLTHVVDMTGDGDRTVLTASQTQDAHHSAHYINLKELNASNPSRDFDHSNVTETSAFQLFFDSLIRDGTTEPLPEFVTTTIPDTSEERRLRLRVLSPLTLSAYDSEGRHTGLVSEPGLSEDFLLKEEGIPGSYYEEFGEGKYIGLPADDTYTIELNGYDAGTFTLEASISTGDNVESVVTFNDLPVSVNTRASIVIDTDDLDESVLLLDQNGDGENDVELSGTSISSPTEYIELIKTYVLGMDVRTTIKDQLEAKLINLANLILGNGEWDSRDSDARATTDGKSGDAVGKKLTRIEKYIADTYSQSRDRVRDPSTGIRQADAESLLNMLTHLRTLIYLPL